MNDEDARQMRRDLLRDVADAAHKAQAELAANQTLAWVRAAEWRHKPSDDFDGCTE